MAQLPRFNSYGNYSGNNYGVHCLCFEDAQGNEYWFSYQTLVAFRGPTGKRVVIKNYWSTTTGKHLNAIDDGDKKSRVDRATFERMYHQEFGQPLSVAA